MRTFSLTLGEIAKHGHRPHFFLPTLLPLLFLAIFPLLCHGSTDRQVPHLVIEDHPVDIHSARYRDLFRELEEQHHFTKAQLSALFSTLTINQKVLQLMNRPGEAKPYHQYRKIFITPRMISLGRQHLATHRHLFDLIEAQFGVDREIIVALWAIETSFGTNQGNFNLFQTLNTLFDAYPRRSLFFRNELINFLLLCRSDAIDPRSVKGSHGGAFGQSQFIPSSFNLYAVDFDGDRKRDIFNSLPDIFASIANYLKHFGWRLHAPLTFNIGNKLHSEPLIKAFQEGRKGRVTWRQIAENQHISLPRSPEDALLTIVGLELPRQKGGELFYAAGYPNFQAITEYNHSNKYAMVAVELMELFKN